MQKWVKKHLTPDYEEKIRGAIRSAETKTSAEIVPMVVASSSGTGHVRPLVVLLLFSFGFVFWPWIHFDLLYPLLPWHVTGLFFVFVMISAWLAPRSGWICNALTTDEDLSRQVHQRAIAEFYESQTQKTLAKTGILLFLSLREKQAVVLADQSVSEHFNPEAWSNVVSKLIEGAKKQNLTFGIISAIQECGEIVSTKLPRPANDQNEIADKLIVKP